MAGEQSLKKKRGQTMTKLPIGLLIASVCWLTTVKTAFADSFDGTVNAYGGPAAFDIILVQDC